MRRGTKPSKAKVESKRPAAPSSPKSEDASVRDPGNRLSEGLEQRQTRNRELAESLEQQTATSEILRVISSSPTDVQPVFDTIVRSATRLCRAVAAAVFVTDGRTLYEPANYGGAPEALAAARARYPRPLDRETASGTAILMRSLVHVPDVQEPSATEFAAFARRVGREIGFRSLLSVPMLREGEAVGAINVTRSDPGLFSDTEVALLKTFADQAVIAIENVRLFKELESRNSDLTRALDQQTATGDILRVIAGSRTDVQPVFEAIVRNAARLCGGANAALFRTDGQTIEHPAHWGASPDAYAEVVRRYYPMPLNRWTQQGQAMLERAVVYLEDSEAPSTPPLLRDVARRLGFRSQVTIPMLRDDQPVGAITVARTQPGRFEDAEIALLQSFADQAVIAI